MTRLSREVMGSLRYCDWKVGRPWRNRRSRVRTPLCSGHANCFFFGHARKCVSTALAASTRCCCVRWATEPVCPGRFSRRSPAKRRPKQIIAASAVDAGSNCAGNVLRWRSFTSGRSPHAAGALAVPRYRDRLSCGQQRHFKFISQSRARESAKERIVCDTFRARVDLVALRRTELPLPLSSSQGHGKRGPDQHTRMSGK